MAQGTYYAWAPIKVGGERDKDTGALSNVKTIEVGDPVTAGDLDTDDEGFQQYIESGAVREIEFPEDVPQGMSPTQYLRQKMLDAGWAVETTGGTYLLNEVEQMNVARAAQIEADEAEEVPDEEVDPEKAKYAHMPIVEGKDLSMPAEGDTEQPATQQQATTQTTTAAS